MIRSFAAMALSLLPVLLLLPVLAAAQGGASEQAESGQRFREFLAEDRKRWMQVNAALAKKSETTRMDAAAGLAILLRENAEELSLATFSDSCVELPPRRGFALRDAIVKSQAHASTYLKRALTYLSNQPDWKKLDRLIVITDEQSHDGILPAWTAKAYVVNVAPHKRGLSYGNGWTHIDGWSERIVDYITAVEAETED